MTRAEWYAAGVAYGERWADEDARNGTPASDTLREWRGNAELWRGDVWRAYWLGALRGYRALTRRRLSGEVGTVSVRIRFNPKHGHYGLWDPETGWVDKFGRASDDYYAETREVAVMRRRDLNQYRKDLAATRNVTAEPPADALAWDEYTGRGDPAQRFRLYRLCPCEPCSGAGKVNEDRCPECRGEGRALELVATCASAEAVGVTLVTLGREGEWKECPVGVLDTEGETGQKWLVSPWLPSPRNVSDAGKLLRSRVGKSSE